MKASELLLALALKHQGDWDKIYKDLQDKKTENLEEYTKGFNTPYITILDEEYPDQLKSCWKPPFVLFYHGDIRLLKDVKNNIAFTGARKVSEEGENIAKYIGGHLDDKNIVCGLSQGSETIALKQAISNGNRPIIVLGSGINFCYPASNKELYEKAKETGLVLSEYPNMVGPDATTMPLRKRIISALSNVVVCGEFQRHSGTNILISYALSMGKNVYVAPMSMSSETANNEMINDGAFIVVKDNYLQKEE